MSNSQQIILASKSPRRRELLSQIGVSFSTMSVDIDEAVAFGEQPIQYVTRMSLNKALTARHIAEGGALNKKCDIPILASDTAVVFSGEIFGKPDSETDAYDMLAKLSGNTHNVYTAVTVISESAKTIVNDTFVTFRKISHSEIMAYLTTKESFDKAGAYGIQGMGALFIKNITGSYSGVMGLPIYETAKLLSESGIVLL